MQNLIFGVEDKNQAVDGLLSGDYKPSIISFTAKDKAGAFKTLGFLIGGILGTKAALPRINMVLDRKQD